MSKSFAEILQDCIDQRKSVKSNLKDTMTREEIDRAHKSINAPGYINQTFGRMGSKDNVLAR